MVFYIYKLQNNLLHLANDGSYPKFQNPNPPMSISMSVENHSCDGDVWTFVIKFGPLNSKKTMSKRNPVGGFWAGYGR